MGIVSYGIVECQVGGYETVGGTKIPLRWEDFANEIHFNKDSALREAIRQVGAERGWPEDCSIPRWERDEKCIDQGLMTVTLEQFEKAIKYIEDHQNDFERPPWSTAYATLAFMKVMKEKSGREVRLLMYEA